MADLTNFAFATVMDIYGIAGPTIEDEETVSMDERVDALLEALVEGEDLDYDFKLDSLTISNITQEGPTKEARGGIYNKPLIRHKKTMRLEMEDVVARVDTLEHFFGAKVTYETINTDKVEAIAFTDKFPGAVALVGKTYVVDQETGERVWVALAFRNFLPDGVTEINMEAEGDFGMIAIGGELFPNNCGEYFTIQKIKSDCPDENDA